MFGFVALVLLVEVEPTLPPRAALGLAEPPDADTAL